jgi:hypothetical protein
MKSQGKGLMQIKSINKPFFFNEQLATLGRSNKLHLERLT